MTLPSLDNKELHYKLHNKLLNREGVTGLGLLLLCLVFYGLALRPAQLRLDQLQSTVAVLQEKNRQAKHIQKTIKDATPSEQLRDYYRFFPDPDSTPSLLKKIFKAARHERIQLEKGEYRATPEKAGKLIHYQITLPVNGTYPQLRKFLAAVLNNIPTASLDNIRFERQKIGNTEVHAEIKLTLYLACTSHQGSTAAVDASDLTGRSPSSRLDVVTTTPAPSSSPSTPSDRRLDTLATIPGEKCRPGQKT